MSRIYALIPAAGTGARMAAPRPKQYLNLAGRPVLHYAIDALARHSDILRVFVVLAPGDTDFASHQWDVAGDKLVPLYCGGATRAATVFNGLVAVRDEVEDSDWIVVHDAVRPCLAARELDTLIATLRDERTGGLLALPVVDTLKRADEAGCVLRTEPREHLWQAQTPQMFRYRLLLQALHSVDPARATDEAYAIEQLGLKPRLVAGDARNLKVTYPHDLELAATILGGLGVVVTHER